MDLEDGYDDLRNDYNWNLRVNQIVLGNNSFDFARTFTSAIIAVLADTTNINPSNIAGYLVQTINLFQVGGIAQISDRYALPNKIPRVIVFPVSVVSFAVRFKLATPVGNCKVKIWEAIPK